MMIDKYSDDVHFLHMVGPEPHPLFPYANFDSGLVKMNYWSNYRFDRCFNVVFIDCMADFMV